MWVLRHVVNHANRIRQRSEVRVELHTLLLQLKLLLVAHRKLEDDVGKQEVEQRLYDVPDHESVLFSLISIESSVIKNYNSC